MVWHFYVALAKRFFYKVRFIQPFVVDIDRAVFLDIHPVAWSGNDAFNKDLVIIIKSNDIAALEISCFYRYDNVSAAEPPDIFQILRGCILCSFKHAV